MNIKEHNGLKWKECEADTPIEAGTLCLAYRGSSLGWRFTNYVAPNPFKESRLPHIVARSTVDIFQVGKVAILATPQDILRDYAIKCNTESEATHLLGVMGVIIPQGLHSWDVGPYGNNHLWMPGDRWCFADVDSLTEDGKTISQTIISQPEALALLGVAPKIQELAWYDIHNNWKWYKRVDASIVATSHIYSRDYGTIRVTNDIPNDSATWTKIKIKEQSK